MQAGLDLPRPVGMEVSRILCQFNADARPRDLYQQRADSGLAARAIRRYILPRRPGWWRLTHSIVY